MWRSRNLTLMPKTGETRFFYPLFAIIRKNVKRLAVSTSRSCHLSSFL
ncbi:hypothetical protein HMPREF9534_01239 [Escherichia coli MS 69-1]|nr:hypothetical protein HMPREF9534_01239 [Escherichia coli MS 69-1]